MTVFRYIVFQEKLYLKNYGEYYSFGIRVTSSGSINLVDTVSDISTDFRVVQTLADLCNMCSLDPVHLNEVIENILL